MLKANKFLGSRLSIRFSDSVAISLIILAIVIPSLTWVRIFQSPPPDLRDQLIVGGTLFRIGLILISLYFLMGIRLGWWRKVPSNQRLFFKYSLESKEIHVLIGILIAATLLRLFRLNLDLWLDEIDTLIHNARASYGEIITTYKTQNQHFLFSLLAHTSLLIFGESAWALRLPAVLFGVGSVWVLYLLARQVSDQQEAVLTAVLLAFSYHHVWFCQNARGYTILLFWTLLASWLFLKGLQERQPRIWLYYACAVALGVFTHMTMVFVTMGHFVTYMWLLFVQRGQVWPNKLIPLFSGFCLAILLTFQLHAFTLTQIFGPAIEDLSPVVAWRSPLWTLQELLKGLHLGIGKSMGVFFAIALSGVGCLSYVRRQPLVLHFLFNPIVLGSIVIIVIGHPLWPRFFFFAIGFAILIIVRGTMVLGQAVGRILRWPANRSVFLGRGLTIMIIVMSAMSLVFVYRPKQNFIGARNFVNGARQPGDAVVAVGLAVFPYTEYYAPEWEIASNLDQLNVIRSRSARTWVIYTFPLYMQSVHPEILEIIQREYNLIRRFEGTLGGGTIFVYRADDSLKQSIYSESEKDDS